MSGRTQSSHGQGIIQAPPLLDTCRSPAHMVISAPFAERKFWSSKRRRTLLLTASARRYGWFLRSAERKAAFVNTHGSPTCTRTHARRHTHTRSLDKEKSCWKPIKAACVGTGEGTSPQREQKWANTDVPFYYAPKQQVILVKCAEVLVKLNGVMPSS